jgi:predicted flap endonuclease-1-like 5' DNA nuclease
VNGLTLLVLIAFAIGIVMAYRAGHMRGTRAGRAATASPWRPLATTTTPGAPAPLPLGADAEASKVAADAAPASASRREPESAPIPGIAAAGATPSTPPEPPASSAYAAERARLIRSLEGETAVLRRALTTTSGERDHLADLAEERRGLWRALADARTEAARYRTIVIDLENNAPPPLLDGPNAPDDLKLIVGIGPVLERMLHQLGIGTYRQIARWSERDIDEFDARLAEFPGRIRRDAWVTQARALHQSKFGETLAPRDR